MKGIKASIMVVATLWSMTTFAQVINFEKKEHDFGTFPKPKEGGVTCEFKFTNTGNAPLILNRVVATCGCTTPEWTKEPIAAGKSGVISVTYTTSVPGAFEKSITVYSNSKEGTVKLTVKGTAELTIDNPKEAYPLQLSGGLRAVSKTIDFYNIPKGATRTATMEVYNENNRPLKVNIASVPKHLKISIVPEEIRPRDKATILVVYNPKDIKEWGNRTDYFNILPQGSNAGNQNKIGVNAILIEDLSKLTPEQRKQAPNLTFSENSYNFGEMKVNDKQSEKLILTNTGKTELVIHDISTSSPNLIVKADKMTIAPGKNIKIKIDFTPKSVNELKTQEINFITNAPNALNSRFEINSKPKK